ncbi:MAG: DNA-3-methyladenine glycosylase I [Erysipelotrichaceae bacterium]|nr:DNA-3-methyladenine glycosylase I [Erysipelotrichaceae bacterium]
MNRCDWVINADKLYQDYHDHEWGVPVYDDGQLFAMLILEMFHSGLSWYIILKKRSNFYQAFDGFDPTRISGYDEVKINALMNDEGIVRNKAKILATIANANAFIKLKNELGSFSDYLWSFVDNEVIFPKDLYLTKNEISDHLAHDLKQRGFKFLGSVTLFAYLQAVGLINSHQPDCFKYKGEKQMFDSLK